MTESKGIFITFKCHLTVSPFLALLLTDTVEPLLTASFFRPGGQKIHTLTLA